MRGGLAVLELKFERQLPLAINNLIKDFDMVRVSNSKAVFSIAENYNVAES
jgi:hypothetical protein